jgi:hypothetical protein
MELLTSASLFFVYLTTLSVALKDGESNEQCGREDVEVVVA